ncbi:hypothetical protein L2E82_51392 [Cichorium intybus]|nr:hypothetical protein L2E82_51392 [Cichorium intybus]
MNIDRVWYGSSPDLILIYTSFGFGSPPDLGTISKKANVAASHLAIGLFRWKVNVPCRLVISQWLGRVLPGIYVATVRVSFSPSYLLADFRIKLLITHFVIFVDTHQTLGFVTSTGDPYANVGDAGLCFENLFEEDVKKLVKSSLEGYVIGSSLARKETRNIFIQSPGATAAAIQNHPPSLVGDPSNLD